MQGVSKIGHKGQSVVSAVRCDDAGVGVDLEHCRGIGCSGGLSPAVVQAGRSRGN